MAKTLWKPGTMIYPLPAVMVSCGTSPEEYNIITIAWTGTICSEPPMCYISIRPHRHSYNIIKNSGEFVINLTTKKLARATDWCGVRSGKKFDKFKEMNLTPEKASFVKAPLIKESPVNIDGGQTKIFVTGYPILDETNLQTTIRCFLNTLEANGESLTEFGNICKLGKFPK